MMQGAHNNLEGMVTPEEGRSIEMDLGAPANSLHHMAVRAPTPAPSETVELRTFDSSSLSDADTSFASEKIMLGLLPQQPLETVFPADYEDTITGELFQDPVVAADGHTYERQAIEQWFLQCEAAGRIPTSPKTGLSLENLNLIANPLARTAIQTFREHEVEIAELEQAHDEHLGAIVHWVLVLKQPTDENTEPAAQLENLPEEVRKLVETASALVEQNAQSSDFTEDLLTFLEEYVSKRKLFLKDEKGFWFEKFFFNKKLTKERVEQGQKVVTKVQSRRYTTERDKCLAVWLLRDLSLKVKGYRNPRGSSFCQGLKNRAEAELRRQGLVFKNMAPEEIHRLARVIENDELVRGLIQVQADSIYWEKSYRKTRQQKELLEAENQTLKEELSETRKLIEDLRKSFQKNDQRISQLEADKKKPAASRKSPADLRESDKRYGQFFDPLQNHGGAAGDSQPHELDQSESMPVSDESARLGEPETLESSGENSVPRYETFSLDETVLERRDSPLFRS